MDGSERADAELEQKQHQPGQCPEDLQPHAFGGWKFSAMDGSDWADAELE